MNFVLVHGWGFHAGIWADFAPHLGDAEITLIDLGFVSGGPPAAEDWPDDAIAIGHSLGLLWLLERGGAHFRALVSIQGFDCFHRYIARNRIAALQRGLDRDPGGTLQAFWRSCGAPGFALPQALDRERLAEGLDWLMFWDEAAARAALDCPMLALASRDDPIVPPAMSEAIWGETGIEWSQDGAHVLPLTHPQWCARHVLEFASALPA